MVVGIKLKEEVKDMPYDIRTRQFVPEEEIMKDNTGKQTASLSKKEAMEKLANAFVQQANAKDEAKQKELDKEEEESRAIFECVDDVVEQLQHKSVSNTPQNVATLNRIEAELKKRKQELYQAISICRDRVRCDSLIAEYKKIDSQLLLIAKGKRKNGIA